jgi:hypothetical protein
MDRNSSFKKTSLAKILNSIPYDNGFHFYHGIGNYTGVTATSLAEFAEKLQIIDANSIRFHFQRGDFQKWIKDTIGDVELAKRINMLSGDLPEEDSRKQLSKLVQTRIIELKTFI